MKKLFTVFAVACFAHVLLSQDVNQFTGAFSYNVPLLHVPSNRGTGVAIDANYSAGIQMNQPAGEIGLGWLLNAGGAIYRNVVGFPDDTKNYFSAAPTNGSDTRAQGSLYPDLNTALTDYDLSRTQKGLDTTEFLFPGYDNFTVYGPDFSGQMKLSYLKFYSYKYNITSAGDYKYQPSSASSYYRKPQFHFSNDFMDTLVSRHYPNPFASAPTSMLGPNSTVSGYGYPGAMSSANDPYIGYHQGAGSANQNFDPTTGRLATSNFIEYFTNDEINNNTVAGLVDYQSSHTRSSNFPAEGIGYFRITLSSGITLHYALPVYVYENTEITPPLDNNYSLEPTADTVSYSPATTTHPNNPFARIKNKTTNRYAEQWLLTAVTGPDYVDSNNNKMADDGDAGYWVSYDYQKWDNGGSVERSPYYGYEYQYNPDGTTQDFPVYFPFAQASAGAAYKLSGLYGSVNISKRDLYYLSRIHTSSHTAVFVRDIRKDEKGGDISLNSRSGFKPAPKLLLKRILLLRNEDLSHISTSAFTTSSYTGFNFLEVNNSGLYTEPWYQANHSSFDAYILKQVEFDQDYSLCRNYHGNINVTSPGTSILSSQTDVLNNLSVSTYTASGKLTLNRILNYGFQNSKIRPSLKFDYLTSYNPDYHPKKVDYWGYYKSDATSNAYSRYTTTTSQSSTKAWCLWRITDALGGTTEMDYESNTYVKVVDDDAPSGVRGQAYIYRIKDASNYPSLLMEEGGTSNVLNEMSYLNSSTIPGLKAVMCVPYFSAVSDAYYNSNPTSGNLVHGFVFGTASSGISSLANTNVFNPTTNLNISTTGAYAGINEVRYYGPTGGLPYTMSSSDQDNHLGYYAAYSGNGFVMFETPVGYTNYGGGVRVKSITTRNSASEQYVTKYTYEGGVATNVMDRFNYQVLKTGSAGSTPRYTFLQPKSYDLFNLNPGIGYSKVTIENAGQLNVSNGRTELYYITDPSAENGQFSQNYAIKSYTISAAANLNTINECVNRFTIFGAVKETRIFDKNSNLLSRIVNEYEPTLQAATVENFYFENPSFYSTFYPYNGIYSGGSYTVNIFRNIPYQLKSSTSYGLGGTVQKEETLVRDEITGESTTIRSSGENQSSSLSYKIPAYKYYPNYSGLSSVSFTDPAFRTLLPLGADAYVYSNIDTTLTGSMSGTGYSSSFLNASFKTYSNIIRKRVYNTSTGLMGTSQVTLSHYFNNRMFAFDAGMGSMDDYGLLKKSNINSNALSLSTLAANLFWEPSGTYNWRMQSEVTLIDRNNHTVEMRDLNNRFSASRYGYKGYYKSASVSNCNYASFTFADFENDRDTVGSTGVATLDGDVTLSNNNLLVNLSNGGPSPHTGAYSVKAVSGNPVTFSSFSQNSPGGTLEIGLQSDRVYRASVWVHNTNLSNAQMVITIDGVVSGSSYSQVYTVNSSNHLVTTINSWNLLQFDFNVPAGFYAASGVGHFKIELGTTSAPVYFDDLVFRPVESNFSASVYDPRNGRVLSDIDENGLATNYVYNAEGQTLEVWKEIPSVGYKKIKQYTYNYARGAND